MATVEELEAQLTAYHGQIKALRAKKREVSAQLDGALIRKAMADKLAAMSDPERAALAQMLTADGIAPRSAVGTPGV